ncbi:hypothetical protein [Aquimarina sediminis]|uniref:hypothetical protein n=1 Tax=Aquimarina sediminis TaxID=2070536 RepID=UPI000CA04EF0|nr:hypothetical protein [Aquimarina sediminis]
MILGRLSLFQKRGIFYTDMLLDAKDQFSAIIDKELSADPMLHPSEMPTKCQITPVEEPGNTDYIRATFEDYGKAEYPYEVTVWILIEEVPTS